MITVSTTGSGGDSAETIAPGQQRQMVLMFTDLVNSSGLKMQLGDVLYARAVASPHNQLFRGLLAHFPGAEEINYTGDGFLANFRSVSDAVETALLFHQALREHAWEAVPVQTRIGIHVGAAVMLDGGDPKTIFIASHAADMCARLMSLGLGGQTLLTRHAFDDARQYVRAHPALPGAGEPPPLAWDAHGRYRFKGRDDDPMEVFEVGAVGFAALKAPPDGEKAKRVLDADEEETLGWRPAADVEVPGKPGWVVKEKLGEGGFGEVWLARQRKTGVQRVFKFCFDPDRLRSLKRELTIFRLIRESLGDRDDIARLHDVRLDKPPFYLESDFVPSGNLTLWAEHKGGIETIPLEARLEMMRAICRAVAAAHSVGIIHKDIKPSNVLMREDAVGHAAPVLADFGIGIVTDQSQFEKLGITQAGFTMSLVGGNDSSRTGTRMYSPPESIVGKPSTVQGDVFALGVLLYQLAVGDLQRPLATGWEKDVPDPILRDDIAAATAGKVGQRLRDVNDLIDRLASQPVRRKKLRRAQLIKKTGIAVAGVAVATILCALGLSVFHKGKINRLNAQIQQRLESGTLSEKDVAESDRLVAELARESAEDASEQRRRVVDQLATFTRTAIHRANLADADKQQIESWLALLEPRDAARVKQLRAELAGRLRQWEPAYELKPPFDKARELAGVTSKTANEIRFSEAQVPLPVETQGATRVEADFASLKDLRAPIGFAFEDEKKLAYTFRVIPPARVGQMKTKYTLDLNAPGIAEQMNGWSAPMSALENVSISLVGAKPVMQLKRAEDEKVVEVKVAKLFDARAHAGKFWTVSWSSHTNGFSKPDDGAQLVVQALQQDAKLHDISAQELREKGGAVRKSFQIPADAVRVQVNFRLFSKAHGTYEISNLRIVENDSAEEKPEGMEIYSMPAAEWLPGKNEAHVWFPSCEGKQLQLLSENGKKFLRFSNEPDSVWTPFFSQKFPADPTLIKSVTLTARIRAPFEMQTLTTEDRQFPRVNVNALDRTGKGQWNEHLSVTKQGDWQTRKVTMKSIPPSTDFIEFGVSIDHSTKGAIDVSDLTCEIEPMPVRPGVENQARLVIFRDKSLLSDSLLPPDALAGETVRLAAERVGNSLRVQAGQQRPLEVFDPFPLAAQNFHPVLLTAPGLPLRSLAIFRQRLPEKPQPLELGDQQFFAGNFAGAMSAYEAQLPTAADAATREQARFKIGLCLLQQKRDKEAEARFVEAAKADAPPWSGLASCQLLALYLGQQRIDDADAVLAALRTRRDFAETIGSITSDVRRAIYKGYNTLGRRVLESGDQAEWLATIERLQRILEIADVLQIDAGNQQLLRFEICRLYARSGQTARTLEYCVEQLDGMEKENFMVGSVSGMMCEIYHTFMARGGRIEQALPLLQKWDALTPNELTTVVAARVLVGMKRLDEADAKTSGVLGLKMLDASNHISNQWLYAALLKGLIAEMRDGAEAGRASWAVSFRKLRDTAPNHDPASCINKGSRPSLLGFIMLGGLSGELNDEDMPSLRKSISNVYAELDTGTDTARQTMHKSLPALFSKQVCLSLCTGERGAAFARRFIRGDLLFFEAYRMPFILMVEEFFIQDSIGRESLTAEQEAFYWRMSESLNDALSEKQLTSAQMLSLLAAWKGVTSLFGWAGVEAQFPPAMRGPIAYVMGQRYVKLGRRDEALEMFRTAQKDAAQVKDGAQLAALAGKAIEAASPPNVNPAPAQ